MKKLTALALVAVLALTLLTACDGGNKNTPGNNTQSGGSNSSSAPSASNNGGNNSTTNTSTPPASDNGGSNSSTNTPAQTDSVSHDYDQVIYEGEGLKVTVTGYYFGMNKFGSLTHSFYYTVENNSDKNIRCRFRRVSVNGCMVDSNLDFSFNTSDQTDAGTTNSDAYVEFTDSYLTDRGITGVRDFEFTIFFGDSDDFNKTLFDSGPVTIQVPGGSGAAQTFDADGVVAFNGGGVKITAIRMDYDIYFGLNHGLWVFIENNSGVAVNVSADRRGEMSCVVANGKVAYEYITFGVHEVVDEVWLEFFIDPLDEDANGNKWRIDDDSGKDGPTITFDDEGKALFLRYGI